jgi:hypothetical protein
MLSTILGIALIAVALRDIFDTLFHPHGRGVASESITRLVWRAVRAAAGSRAPLALTLAGPLAFSVVLALWVGMVTLGGALIIEPRLGDDYVFSSGIDPETYSGLVDAISISLVNLTSLGYGDAVATSTGLRVLGPVQALIGLGLITASVSWILSIYRVITLMAVVAWDATETVAAPDFEELEPAAQWPLISELSTRVIEVRRDLMHFPISYCFHRRDPRADLSVALPPALEVCERLAERSPDSAVRFQALRLSAAIDDLAGGANDEYFSSSCGDTEEVFRRWREDHLREMRAAGTGGRP